MSVSFLTTKSMTAAAAAADVNQRRRPMCVAIATSRLTADSARSHSTRLGSKLDKSELITSPILLI